MINGVLRSEVSPKEHILARSMEMLMAETAKDLSYRKTCALLNSILHRSEGEIIRLRTLKDTVQRIGNRMADGLERICRKVLGEQGSFLSPETGMVTDHELIPDAVCNPVIPDEEGLPCPEVRFASLVRDYNSGKKDLLQIPADLRGISLTEQNPKYCVYVSIDDVLSKHQKDTRKNGGSKKLASVCNTTITIQTVEGSYNLHGENMDIALKRLLAFLNYNHLLENRHLIFFTDGASSIRKKIEQYFTFCPYTHLLDWFHLEKKTKELFSMAVGGSRSCKKSIRSDLLGILWSGNIDGAVEYLSSLEESRIKNHSRLTELTEYLKRKKPYVPCYALRNMLGYRNSSNAVEKANDLIISARQKHNGMSWSFAGSGALATIAVMCLNGEQDGWINNRSISFKLIPANTAA